MPDEVGAVLTIEGTQIFRKMKEAIFFAAHAPEMIEYLQKYEWGESFDFIDWQSHKKAWESTPPGQNFQLARECLAGYQQMTDCTHGYPRHIRIRIVRYAVMKLKQMIMFSNVITR